MASWDNLAVPSPTAKDYAAPIVDWSKINNLQKDYYQGAQMQREENKASIFRNGIPKDASGNIDVGTITDKLARINPDYAMPLINMQLQGQQGQTAANAIMGSSGPGAPASQPSPTPQRGPAQPAVGPSQPQSASAGAAPKTVMSIMAINGTPNDQLQSVSASVARQLGVDPNEPIDTNDPQVRNVLAGAIKQFKGVGQVVASDAAPAPQQPAQSPQQLQTAAPQSTDSNPPGFTQADANNASQRADRLFAYSAAIANINPKAAEAAKAAAEASEARAKQIRDYISGEDTSTSDQKNYQSDKLPGESMVDYQSRSAGGAELAKQDSVAYSKKYEGIQKASQEASVEQPKIQLMKQFANDPNFYSGPLEPTNRGFKQFAATIGADPNKALPQEGFNKVASDMLTSQIRALGASGAGPVRIAEVKNMQKSIANLGITPVTNRLLVEITDRTYNDIQHIADLTRKYAGDKSNRPGQMNVGLDQQIHDYYEKHPLFTKEEISDPRLIAPPEFKDSRAAFNAKLPKGQPVKIDGKLKWVQ